MNVRIYEIFTSLEGEGMLCGTKTLFVRLAGCPFGCFYCDTEDALPADSGKEHTIEEACSIIRESLEPNTYKVNFTGGEPLVQYEETAQLARFVQSIGVRTYLESSCYDSERFAAVAPFIDYLKVEFKTQDSEFTDAASYPRMLHNALECLRISARLKKSTYVKIVVSSRTSPASFGKLVGEISGAVPPRSIAGLFIQPTHGVAEPDLALLLKLYDEAGAFEGKVRVIPQLHKLIGAP